jgi:hypothetical protein
VGKIIISIITADVVTHAADREVVIERDAAEVINAGDLVPAATHHTHLLLLMAAVITKRA